MGVNKDRQCWPVKECAPACSGTLSSSLAWNEARSSSSSRPQSAGSSMATSGIDLRAAPKPADL